MAIEPSRLRIAHFAPPSYKYKSYHLPRAFFFCHPPPQSAFPVFSFVLHKEHTVKRRSILNLLKEPPGPTALPAVLRLQVTAQSVGHTQAFIPLCSRERVINMNMHLRIRGPRQGARSSMRSPFIRSRALVRRGVQSSPMPATAVQMHFSMNGLCLRAHTSLAATLVRVTVVMPCEKTAAARSSLLLRLRPRARARPRGEEQP